MASEEGSPTYLLKGSRPPPPALTLEPSMEADYSAREPREVPVIWTSGGTPAAADPDEAIPDKPLQTSVEAATKADQPGPTAESGACTTDVLLTVEKSLNAVKPAEVTISEEIPEDTTRASCDLAARRPTWSQGRSVKETMVFGPSEWDVPHLNPVYIHSGAQIRPVRRSGKNGFNLIHQSILQKTFDVTSLIIVWRDEKQDRAAQPPRYFCADGMHRIEVVQELITQKQEDWPPGMFDRETGKIRRQCGVLRETPPWKKFIICALARNSRISSVVETT
jgi:hypothetical protein